MAEEEKLNGVLIDKFECKLSKVQSLEEYFKEETGPNGECTPCRIQPLASLYAGVLENAGEVEAAKKLYEAYETQDILTIAKSMDTIKASAKNEIRQQLESLDCLAQSPEVGDEQEAT